MITNDAVIMGLLAAPFLVEYLSPRAAKILSGENSTLLSQVCCCAISSRLYLIQRALSTVLTLSYILLLADTYCRALWFC